MINLRTRWSFVVLQYRIKLGDIEGNVSKMIEDREIPKEAMVI